MSHAFDVLQSSSIGADRHASSPAGLAASTVTSHASAGCSLVSGVTGLITTFWMRNAPGFWWSSRLSAALGVLVGGMLLARPVSGARCSTLTIVLVAFFIIEGIVAIIVRARSQARTVRPLGLDAA